MHWLTFGAAKLVASTTLHKWAWAGRSWPADEAIAQRDKQTPPGLVLNALQGVPLQGLLCKSTQVMYPPSCRDVHGMFMGFKLIKR
jgi:hypothetical protein